MENDYSIPLRYTKSRNLQSWFIGGFTNGFRNAARVNENDFRRIQGDRVWEAYTDGYQAGKKVKGESEEK
jgi:hypothetical protein